MKKGKELLFWEEFRLQKVFGILCANIFPIIICYLVIFVIVPAFIDVDSFGIPDLFMTLFMIISYLMIFMALLKQWAHTMIPKYKRSMFAMYYVGTYRILKNLLEKEEFTPTLINGVFISDLWIDIQGFFIPKNFIIGICIYDDMGYRSNHSSIAITLLDGRVCKIKSQNCLFEFEQLMKLLPNVITSNLSELWLQSDNNQNKLKNKVRDYIKNGGNPDDLIASCSAILSDAVSEEKMWEKEWEEQIS